MDHDPLRVRVLGPLEPYAHGFARELVGQGYVRESAAFQLHLIAHLSRWLAGEGLDAGRWMRRSSSVLWPGSALRGIRTIGRPRRWWRCWSTCGGLGVIAPPAPVIATTPVEVLWSAPGFADT